MTEGSVIFSLFITFCLAHDFTCALQYMSVNKLHIGMLLLFWKLRWYIVSIAIVVDSNWQEDCYICCGFKL